ncbi:hypothetical protein Fleli_0679 [Bernardetia litoralis DSM 6794]|uniref:Uncharacterized protein n=1 Tax=Bernardetia litoralis (strain ATCC 23117 / DSM 6794 / NBRC 15988 / NCIMB 1366 / Fx l1 / Sio-4) TaxID=880071 RepID=I4AGQ7_BERLS|nr:hypothetical protein [Bernardetia litoralis]AFM03142.1 hypothetical protein Fleli_0679 [Bernardetia litoralis DSM 6794]
MKFIYIFSLLFLFFSCKSTKNNSQNLDTKQITNQDLKIVKGYMYQVEQNQITSDTVLSTIKWYNNKKLVKEENYWTGEEGKNIERIIYTNNGEIKSKKYILNDSTHIQKTEFERDEKGELSRQILSYNDDHRIINQENMYNKNNKIIESIGRFENVPKEMADEFTSYSKYKYDTKGNLIELSQSTQKEKLTLITYKYDENKNLIEELTLNYKNSEKFKTVYFYDKDNQIIKKEIYQNDEWDFTMETFWKDGIIESQKTYYAPFTKEEYHEITFFEII